MRTSLSAPFFLTVALLTSISVSLSFAQDLEGSGLDLEISASGDGSEEDSNNDIPLADNKPRDGFHSSSDLGDIRKSSGESGWVILESKKGFLENPDLIAGVIAGGLTGTVLGAAITAVLIYKWQKRAEAGNTRSKRKDSNEYFL